MNHKLLLGLSLSFGSGMIVVNSSFSAAFAQQIHSCPPDLETLGNLLIRDIPDYANRVIQKSSFSALSKSLFSTYVLVASQPEFEPIPLTQIQYRGKDGRPPQQIFFTVLERQYLGGERVVEAQNYHWVLLTKTAQNWRLVMALSRLGSSAANQPPSPPRDSTHGIMGQAVKLWLRDCNDGKIKLNLSDN